ncbi:calcium/sodium antiporter [Haloglomus halophilum]|uniref:calcium/sodium antiporter n=1 Tax=Haloglomus halophilum TaxID=2962672 RepID=UPI0020C98441|nr:calcium/sodium antiporter [Haloglomus halophilum]
MVATGLLLDAGAVAAGIVALWLGASRFVAGAGDLAARAGIPPLVVGLTVVAIGTSLPEFAVTIGAALAGRTDVSVANVVGSNVVNLGIVLGGSAVFTALPTPGDIVRRDGPVLVGATLLVVAFVVDLRLSRLEGAVLMALLIAYLALLAYRGVAGPSLAVDAAITERRAAVDVLRVLVGLVAVVVGADLLVGGAVDIARAAGVSDWLIGETVVALGTSAPEIVASAAAIRQGRFEVSAGNIFGSCVVNLLGVLGLAAALRPLALSAVAVEASLGLCAVTLLAVGLAVSRRALSRAEGVLLLAVGLADWVIVALFG